MAEGGKMPVKLSILRHSSIVKDGDPCVYGIPMHQTLRDEDAGFEKLEFGCNHGYAESKVIMMVGETGSGKTTLINGLVNYVFGVDWNDSFRFKMIVEDSRANQAHSQTKDVTSYTLHHQDGFRMPYSLTIIDTPGFGDTKGIKRDREIVEQLRKFFTSPGDLGISHIDAIGFVVQASQARLSVGQKYVFDSILALFGKDISDNIFLLVTFADGQEPEVLNAVREAEIPHKHYFQFNNSALYSQTNKNRKFGSLFWEMGCESFQTFLDKVLEVETSADSRRNKARSQIYLVLSVRSPAPAEIVKMAESVETLKQSILRRSRVVDGGHPRIHVIPMHHTVRDEEAGLEKLEFGCNHGRGASKVIMMVGQTGSGKTTLINGLVNYVFGVDWNDSFRFKMIVEGSHADQAESQTRNVTSYTLHHQDGFRMPYSLTIIDTPGFGDTKGIKRDREIVEQLRKFFTSPGDLGISHIDAIGFVVQASQARLSVGQKYVFDSILALFGKDISDNIFLLVTFADGQEPEVLSAVKKAEIPYKDYFQFNNSALYYQTDKRRKFGSLFWDMGCESFQIFLDKVLEIEKSLKKKHSALNMIDEIQREYDLGQKKILHMADSTGSAAGCVGIENNDCTRSIARKGGSSGTHRIMGIMSDHH
ncbi:hypothetical protein O3P69_009089 [Scylla paramamosain]|uniref:AAA+ ATPase domain-containing protein n=1 Tax=Scylla paramamosain TaxID=85552 RepID=A0AAW0TQL5_SCYPA